MRPYMDVIMAGFGGQGVMLIGNLLAYSAMEEGRNVTYIPVYGPEMRGGTANCTVVIAEEEIGSPVIKHPLSLIIMNHPSLDKFQSLMQDGGTLVYNSSLVPVCDVREGVGGVGVAANEIAAEIGSSKMANMVALGAYVRATGIVALATVEKCLTHVIAPHYAHLIPKNSECLRAGYACA